MYANGVVELSPPTLPVSLSAGAFAHYKQSDAAVSAPASSNWVCKGG